MHTGAVFAVCPVNTTGPQAVEAVLDSSRYFVLRIEDGAPPPRSIDPLPGLASMLTKRA
jgi:hypothetical protein